MSAPALVLCALLTDEGSRQWSVLRLRDGVFLCENRPFGVARDLAHREARGPVPIRVYNRARP